MERLAIRRMTAAAVLLVATIAAVVSYIHIQYLAATHGQAALAAACCRCRSTGPWSPRRW